MLGIQVAVFEQETVHTLLEQYGLKGMYTIQTDISHENTWFMFSSIQPSANSILQILAEIIDEIENQGITVSLIEQEIRN